MEKLRVAKKSLYTIEVNDKGETITFNLEDPTLLLRMEKAYEDVNKVANKFEIQMNDIENSEVKNDSEEMLLTDGQRNTFKAFDDMFKEMRNIMDGFLGKGACQKIFGDDNYLSMYTELFESLQPHFQKMGLNSENYLNSIKDKYSNNNGKGVLEA